MTPYSELPDAELRIAVMKKLGWRVVTDSDELGNEWDIWSATDDSVGYICDYGDEPDFPNSLDACEPVKKWLRERGWRIDVFIPRDVDDEISVKIIAPTGNFFYAIDKSESRALCLAFMEVEE